MDKHKKCLTVIPLVLALLMVQVSAITQYYMFPNCEDFEDGLDAWDRWRFVCNRSPPYTSVSCFPDVDRDGDVDYADLYQVSSRLGAEPEDENWSDYANLHEDEIINYKDTFWVAHHYGEDYSCWSGKAHDASDVDWTTVGTSQGIGIGGDVHNRQFRVGTTEGGASDGSYITIYANQSVPEDMYYLNVRIRVENRTAYYDDIWQVYNFYERPLLTIGINFHWQWQKRYGDYYYWSDFNNSNPYAVKRGIYNDIFFDFALWYWESETWDHHFYEIGDYIGLPMGRYDLDYHFSYVACLMNEQDYGEWMDIDIDLAVVWNLMMEYAKDNWEAVGEFTAFRLWSIDCYLEAMGASIIAQYQYCDINLE